MVGLRGGRCLADERCTLPARAAQRPPPATVPNTHLHYDDAHVVCRVRGSK